MPISNVKVQYIPGFENPATSFQINTDGDSNAAKEGASNNKKGMPNIQFINPAGNGYGPHATNMADIATKIPSKPSLKPSCEKCQKRANQSGKGFSCCSSCKVSRYCSRECQTSHWKEHKFLCGTRVKHVKNEQDVKAQALLTNGPFVSQASLRKWYYDNVDIVDYAIAQELELYKGPTHTLWRTHAVVFSLTGGKKGTDVQSTEIKFSDAEAVSAIDLTRKDRLSIAPQHFHALGLGTRIIVVFLLNREDVLMLVESRDLPLGEEWAGMERDEMWRMHIRMRQMALQLTGGEAGEKSGGDTAETLA